MLLSILASAFGIKIDRAIGAPGHGKDIVDGLNATDKVFLRKKMCMIGTPEAKEGAARIAAHSMVSGRDGDAKHSLATESARLEQIELKWERGVEPSQQPRFASSKKCQWWSIFAPRELQSDGSWKMLEGAGLNDWKIISLEEKKGSDPSARSMRTPTATTWSCSPACPTRCRRTSS